MRSNGQVPLPKGWPRTIRSAVIHAISLTRCDRLRQDVAILIKEMRIKDARMLQITAERMGHVPLVLGAPSGSKSCSFHRSVSVDHYRG